MASNIRQPFQWLFNLEGQQISSSDLTKNSVGAQKSEANAFPGIIIGLEIYDGY